MPLSGLVDSSGVTALAPNAVDDTSALQATINRVRDAGGGRVYLKEGVYLLATSLQLYTSVELIGASQHRDISGTLTHGTTIRPKTTGIMAGLPLIDVSSTTRAAVRKIALCGPTTDATNNTVSGISDFTTSAVNTGATLLTIEDCWFSWLGAEAIALAGNANFIYRNEAYVLNSHYIHLRNDSVTGRFASDSHVAFNIGGFGIGNGTTGAAGAGLYLNGASACVVDANEFYNFKYGIQINGALMNRIVANRLEKHDNDGIYVGGSASGNLIANNNIFNCGYVASKNGINLLAGAIRNIVQGNNILNWTLAAGGGTGFQDGNMDAGISVSGSSQYNLISGNYIHNPNKWGITLDSASFTDVVGNKVNKCGADGIRLQNGSSDNTLRDNSVILASQTTDAGFDGVIVTGNSDRNSIVGQYCRHGGLSSQARYGVNIATSDCDNNSVYSCDLQTAGRTFSVGNTGTGTTLRDIRGYATEKASTNSVASGSTTRTVAHGLPFTPVAGEIAIHPTGWGSATRYWVTGIDATNFVVNTDVDPGASGFQFGWSAAKAG